MNFYKPKYKHVVRNNVPFLMEKKKKLFNLKRTKWNRIKRIYNFGYRYKKILVRLPFSRIFKAGFKSSKKRKSKKLKKVKTIKKITYSKKKIRKRKKSRKYKKKLMFFILFQHTSKYRGKKYNRVRPFRLRKSLKRFYIIKERCCQYFGRDRFSFNKFRRFAIKAKRISSIYKKNYASIFHHTLESRLIFFLVRLRFVATQYEARHLIASRGIITNLGNKIPFNYFLKKGDCLSFDKGFFYFFYRHFLSKNIYFFLKFCNFKRRKSIFDIRKKRFLLSSLDLNICKKKTKYINLLFFGLKVF